jgi:NAD(P)-dependent dehydrogenase (short-subunit alcohol dehydrogenase family)
VAKLLDGKVAIITGAARGIGKGIAHQYAAEGARLLLTDFREDEVKAVAAGLPEAEGLAVDVTDEGAVARAVDAAVERFGRLDIVVNNAGAVGVMGPIDRIDAGAWDATMRLLVDGVFYGIKHASRVMKAQKSGRILVTSSTSGLAGGIGAHCYTTSKHAVIGMVRSAARELAGYGITVNSVAPGVVVSQMAIDGLGGFEGACAFSAQESPLGLPILPEELAGAYVFLASDMAKHVTGQTLTVDGGATIIWSPMADYTYAEQ